MTPRRLGAYLRLLVEAEDAPVTLVACPPSGGNVAEFAGWGPDLPRGWRLVAAQYPARQDRLQEDPVCDLRELAQAIAGELATLPEVQGSRLVLYGHSMGATVAFEAALGLQRAGHHRAEVLAVASQVPCPRAELSSLDEADVIEWFRGIGDINPLLLAHPGLRARVVPAFMADAEACVRYRCTPGDRVTADILAFSSDDDPLLDPGAVAGWRERTTGSFAWHRSGGGHFFVREHGTEILAELGRHVERARELDQRPSQAANASPRR